tara:strand:+ start:2176 stop:2412 length:237 start_codon:yes stop_codon:yes gene_type:complete
MLSKKDFELKEFNIEKAPGKSNPTIKMLSKRKAESQATDSQPKNLKKKCELKKVIDSLKTLGPKWLGPIAYSTLGCNT